MSVSQAGAPRLWTGRVLNRSSARPRQLATEVRGIKSAMDMDATKLPPTNNTAQ